MASRLASHHNHGNTISYLRHSYYRPQANPYIRIALENVDNVHNDFQLNILYKYGAEHEKSYLRMIDVWYEAGAEDTSIVIYYVPVATSSIFLEVYSILFYHFCIFISSVSHIRPLVNLLSGQMFVLVSSMHRLVFVLLLFT